jgi:Pyridine nucleotide-disulphide oxidoreductase, dimerisation domain
MRIACYRKRGPGRHLPRPGLHPIKNAKKVLQVHLIGPPATDLISEGTLAVSMERAVQEIAGTIHAHPTLAEVMLEASLKAMHRPQHG